ncbi:MAG: class I tRNA ligase family protein [Rhodobacter sp.]|nr:class I tRNA ligase family protein [Rhodobacter sp.]
MAHPDSATRGRTDIAEMERKWQARWAAAGCFSADFNPGGKPFFNFDGGPFPNGDLHMGHVRTFTLGDVMARYQRMCGKRVLYCFEFDAFGLPNELAAEAKGTTPAAFTDRNIETMRRQMCELGLSYDWDHVHSTCDPKYYRWTQWLFLTLFERDLVYREEATLNWCAACETTLAHMQVEEGRCWRCAAPVERRRFPQWFVRLSGRSAELYDSLQSLDGYGKLAKNALSGFIAPVAGRYLQLPVVGRPGVALPVFVPDGQILDEARFLAASTDCDALTGLLPQTAEGTAAREFCTRAHGRLRRTAGDRAETGPSGVATGIWVRHPTGDVSMPVLLSDRVDGGFAGGLRLGLPGSSPTDDDIWRSARPGEAAPPDHGMKIRISQATEYRVHDWLVSRQRRWGTPIPVIHCPDCGAVPVPGHALPVPLPDAGAAAAPDVSCPACAGPARRDSDTLDCYFDVIWCFLACASKLGPDFSFRKEDFDPWMPVDWFHNGIDSFLYLHLYRFLGLVLHEAGFLDGPEPILRYHGHDSVLLDGRKMSKSHGNVVSPKVAVERHGADALRLHILNAANPASRVDWSDRDLTYCDTLLARIDALVRCNTEVIVDGLADADAGPHPKLNRATAGVSRKITQMIENYRYRACIAELVKCLELLERYAGSGSFDRETRRGFALATRRLLVLLAPFAPHIAEELWSAIGGAGLIATTDWPTDANEAG